MKNLTSGLSQSVTRRRVGSIKNRSSSWVIAFLLLTHCILQILQVKAATYDYPTKNLIKSEQVPLFDDTSKTFPTSYVGILPIRSGGDRLFYWYFESDASNVQDLIVVLNGGPGCGFSELIFMVGLLLSC